MDKFYTSEAYFLRLYDKIGRMNGFRAKTVAEFLQWKTDTRKLLRGLIGLERMEACPLEPQILKRVELEGGITREKLLIQVEPEVYMPVFVLLPSKGEQNGRCFIAAPGHDGGGKFSVAGVREIEVIAGKIQKYNYDYGLQLAKRGYTVFCPDCRGFGERRERAMQGVDTFADGSCYQLAHMAEPLGRTVIGMQVWDLMRLLDYIEAERRWDTEKIGCVGFSGGGMQTLWLAALDDRIAYPIISGYMYGCRDSLLKLNGNCNCNYVPHLWEHVDMGDIGALIAPRTMMVQSCSDDHLNGERGLTNVMEQMEVIRGAYALFAKNDRLYHDICEGGHRWHDENLDFFLTNYIQ